MLCSTQKFYIVEWPVVNTGQKNLICFVPRTSICELGSTLRAEFRYLHRIFLSGRVSKIQRNLYVQISTFVLMKQAKSFL